MELKIDMHVHTEFSYDSNNRIEDIIRIAKEKKLDGVGLVDHDTTAGFSEMIRIGKEQDFIVIPGVEIRVRGGYLLAYGHVEELPPRGEDAAKVMVALKKQDVLTAAVHPFKNGLGLKDKVSSLELDAIETANGGALFGDSASQKIAESMNLPRIGGSDAHFLDEIGSVVLIVRATDKSVDGILNAIKKGNTEIIQNKAFLRILISNLKKTGSRMRKLLSLKRHHK